MKIGSSNSFRAAGAFGPEDPDEPPISDSMLIRQWWHTYLGYLQGNHSMEHLHELTDECERRGIVKKGTAMTRTAAEDLAKQCDEAIKRKVNQ